MWNTAKTVISTSWAKKFLEIGVISGRFIWNILYSFKYYDPVFQGASNGNFLNQIRLASKLNLKVDKYVFPKSIEILSLSVRYRDAGDQLTLFQPKGTDYTHNITQYQTHPKIWFLDGAASYVGP